MNKFIRTLGICLALMACSCNDMPEIAHEQAIESENTCRMTFDAPKPCFDAESRAGSSTWLDGDVVYLLFVKSDGAQIAGKAVYNVADNYWSLSYNGTMPAVTDANCYAYYIEDNVKGSHERFNVTALSGVYYGQGKYSRLESGVSVRASLTPNQSRIRFTGQSGQKFNVSGPKFYTAFDPQDCTFSESRVFDTSIASDGSSPYIYLSKRGIPNPYLSVSYDNYTFTMYVDSPILDDAKSGYMKLPTKDNHNGWNMTETTVPTLGRTTVSNIKAETATFEASITSNGNAVITECGFVFSKSPNPTVSDTKLLCDNAKTSLTANADGLSKSTTYYVRAYATNSMGTAYGDQAEFKTTQGEIAVRGGLTALYLFENNFDDSTDNGFDGFGVSGPTFVPGVTEGSTAVKFTANSYMKVGSALNHTDRHSTVFWIKDPADGSVFATPTDGTDYRGDAMALEIENGQFRYFESPYYSTHPSYRGDVGKFTHPTITDGKWHHVAIVTDFGVTAYAKDTSVLYIDGKKVDAKTEEDYNHKLTGISFQFGGPRTTGSTFSIKGAPMTVDNLRTYNRCLSASEVKEIYESEK